MNDKVVGREIVAQCQILSNDSKIILVCDDCNTRYEWIEKRHQLSNLKGELTKICCSCQKPFFTIQKDGDGFYIIFTAGLKVHGTGLPGVITITRSTSAPPDGS